MPPTPDIAVRLGLPLWGFRAWCGSVYTKDARSNDLLGQYAQAFSAVEGNTTFYSVPSPDTVLRWRDETPPTFRFCFKLPRAISHDARLRGVERETDAFLERMRPLGPRLGPFMVQLPSSFGPPQLDDLDRFLARRPRDLRFAVELRSRGLVLESGPAPRALEVLRKHTCDWIHLDTRGLRAGPRDHPDVRAARHPKPDLPVHPTRTGPHPIVRFVGHPEIERNVPELERWGTPLCLWAREGAETYLFLHCPNDLHAPAIAREAHARLASHVRLPPPRTWPGEAEPRQLSLL